MVKLPRVLSRPAARQHPSEFDTNNTHTIMFDPDYNMMSPFLPILPILCSLKAIQSLNREQLQYPLLCHHVILMASIAVPSTPWSRKCACQFFAEDWACEIELHQTGVICFPLRQRSWSCGVFKSWISDANCSSQWKWQGVHHYDTSVLQQIGMFFNGIAFLVEVWPMTKREFPRVPMTWLPARVRISNVTSQM